MIELYDAENLVFYDGTGYADHCQLKLIKTVGAPAIQTSMTAPNYEERYESTTTKQGDMYIPLLADEYTALFFSGGSADGTLLFCSVGA